MTRPGEGSRFTFTISTGKLEGVGLFTPQPRSDAYPLPYTELRKLDCSVLVVDDRRDMRYLAEHMLEEAGARVTQASDGRDALEKYAGKGESETVAFLVGIPKFDRYSGYLNHSPRVRSIGVCTNVLDTTDRVSSVCMALRAQFPELSIVFRAHPRDQRNWTPLIAEAGLLESQPNSEQSLAFLQRVDAIISGDSNIILEALLMNVVPIRFDFPLSGADNYGFVRNGVTRPLTTIEELMAEASAILEAKPQVRHLAAPYCATVDTRYDGKSTGLVCHTIDNFLAGTLDHETWRVVNDFNSLQAYQLTLS